MKKLIVLLLCLGLLLNVGCAAKNTESSSVTGEATNKVAATVDQASTTADVSTEPAAAAEEIKGDISVIHFTMSSEMESRKKMSDLFMKKYPNVKVTTNALPAGEFDTKLDAYLAAGNAPDVMMMSPDWYGIRSEFFEDLKPYAEKSEIVNEDFYLKGIYNSYILPDGKLEALPLSANAVVFAYNKSLFDAASVPYPTADWTWDKFKDTAVKLTKGEGTEKVYGSVNDGWIFSWVAPSMYGGSIFDKERKQVTLLDPKSFQGFEMMRYLINDAKAIPDAGVSQTMPSQQMFLAGKAGFYIMAGWDAPTIGEKIGNNFDWDIISLPRMPDGSSCNFTFLTGYSMYKDSKNKDAAWKYIEMISTDKEIGELWAQYAVPCGKEVANSFYASMTLPNSDVSTKPLMEGATDAMMYPTGGVIGQSLDEFGRTYEKIMLKNEPVADALTVGVPIMQEAVDRVNERY